MSIYATMLSAITYLSQPALAYSFDWQAYLGYFTIILIVPIVITFYLPFYRKLKITTAYEYLEKRFNVSIRMFGSASFMLFQLVRMGIVVYLPALAISTVTGMDIYTAIVVMGGFVGSLYRNGRYGSCDLDRCYSNICAYWRTNYRIGLHRL
ncbi:hypothetical protein QIU18_01395 [Capnocytophaga canimorsus]|nr:hypothetical protein [Capnocytophaga canimorsus]WGU68116.1 hypothetical protein QIU19_12435 [Capnocytophaga canimorsus]WGU70785.1 hypothetical protein QIU18_01395 [Capnocytophaga canimorsus]